MPFHDLYHIAERQLIRNVPRLLFHANRTDPLLGDDDSQILRFLDGTIRRPFADT
ncbi:hypothetical protein D3C73_1604080 [compost metagenome]